MAKITIFGLAGTGTTTIGKFLATELGYTFHSTGNIFRKKAASLGLDLYGFEKVCNENHAYDKSLDDEMEAYGKNNDNFLLESRLGWYFVPDSFKIKIICDLDIRIRRVARRDHVPIKEAMEKTLFREQSGIDRYKKYYGIDNFGSDKHFDLIIDSTHISSPDSVNVIIKKLRQKQLLKANKKSI